MVDGILLSAREGRMPRVIERESMQREILRRLLVSGPTTRLQLAEELGLSRASITRFSRDLLEDGVVSEGEDDGRSDGAMGRPLRPLDVVEHSRRFLGVKLTASEISWVVSTMRAVPIAQGVEPLLDSDPEAVIAALADLAGRLADDVPLNGIGVAIAGYADGAGRVEYEDFLGWQDVPLGEKLSARAGIPVTVENDVVALTIAEQWFGAGRGIDHFAVLTIGAGVGYGLVSGGHVVDTANARAGLAGHLPLWEAGPLCPQGHPGCSSAFLATDCIVQQAREAAGAPLTYQQILDPAAPEAVRAVVERSGYALGRVVAEIANYAISDVVILGGEGVGLVDVASAHVDRAIGRFRTQRGTSLELVVDRTGFERWARGAAASAIERAVLGFSGRS
ncbi:ROK family transcriptional regulator [Leifsonia aquatica]|uniref:ROK family transcriptional regulator n=1 Tax=Leifsonia aquatica TaxID=144185 RepID=UPI0013B407A6|nr:ROK family transcriptional regulator [Leifsonia aquatica]